MSLPHSPANLDKHLEQLKQSCEFTHALRGRNREEFEQWRNLARQALCNVLGFGNREAPRCLDLTEFEPRKRGDLMETKFYVESSDEVIIPLYHLQLSSGADRKGVILVFHGHNPSVQYCLGNYPDAETELRMRAKDNHYAEGLARAGWEVFAVEQQGFGERQSSRKAPLHDGSIESSCRDLAIQYAAHGRTLLGERIRDGMAVLDYLQREKAGQPIGVTGNSGGGTTTLWLASLDERVAVSVPGSYLCSFRDSIYAVPHCDCNYVPGILQLMEMGDLAALTAPRPFCAIHGQEDPIFPFSGTLQEFAKIQAAYAIFGQNDRCQLASHPGGHAYHIESAIRYFDQHLG